MTKSFQNGRGRGSVDLSNWKRCLVLAVHKVDFDISLTIREDGTTNETDCRLQGSW